MAQGRPGAGLPIGGDMKVGFIGLGNMGLPLARRLLQAGHKLAVYNRTRARADQLKHLDPVIAETPAAAARGAEVLVTMVADDAALEDVILGDAGALAALPRGAIHVSMSTVSPALVRWLAERHGLAGQTLVAAMSTPVLFTIAQDIAKMHISAAVSEADIGQASLSNFDRRFSAR